MRMYGKGEPLVKGEPAASTAATQRFVELTIEANGRVLPSELRQLCLEVPMWACASSREDFCWHCCTIRRRTMKFAGFAL